MYYQVRALLSEPATLAVGIVAIVLVLAVSPWLSRRLRRPMWLVALTCGSVAAIVAASAGPTAFTGVLRTPARRLRTLAELDSGIAVIRAGASDALPNLLLYLPAGFLLTVLTGRAVVMLVSLVVLSAAIEVGQGLIGRSCTSADWMTNSLGAALGAGAGAVLLLALRLGAAGAGSADADTVHS